MDEGSLIAQACVVIDKHKALAAASGQNFNLFAILGRETDEVQTHSAILGELLDPKGTHGQGAAFTRLFASRFNIDLKGIENARVWREARIGDRGQADILMETGDTRIVIENKIHARDQQGQLERYYAYANRWPKSKVFYLTLHGDEPSEVSLGELSLDKVTRISYQSDVLAWLDDCIKEVARVPQVREILSHYEAMLRRLTGTLSGELTMDLKKLLANKQGDTYNFEAVPRIAEAMTTFSIETEWKFWQELKGKLLETGEGTWRLIPLDVIKNESSLPKEVSEGVIRHAHGSGRNRWEYGNTFRIVSDAAPKRYDRDGVEVLLRVECDGWGWGCYGLVAAKQTANGKRQICRSDEPDVFEEWARRMSVHGNDWHTDHEWWLAWTWPTEDVDLRKTNWLAPEAIRRLVDGGGIDSLVQDIQRAIDTIEGLESGSG